MAFILIIISTCSSLAESLFIKRYNAKHGNGGFIFTAMVSLFAMFFFLITDQNGYSFPEEMIPYAILSGILYSTASVLTFEALICGSYVMSMLILSYSLVFSIIYGLFFLHEPATIYTYLGLVIMLLSLYFTRGRREVSEKKASFKWLICITLSVFGSGMYGVMQRVQQIKFNNSCTNEYMVISMALSAISLFVIGVIKEKKGALSMIKNGFPYAGSAGLSNGLTNMLSLMVNLMIPLSIASPTSAGTKIILSFVLSKLMFKEEFINRQVVGILLGIVSIVLLNI